MAKVDDLVSQALINPELMKLLITKATPANTPQLMGNLTLQSRQIRWCLPQTTHNRSSKRTRSRRPRPCGGTRCCTNRCRHSR